MGCILISERSPPLAGVRVTTPVLRLKSKLDRETTASYNFVLVASGTKENNIPVYAVLLEY